LPFESLLLIREFVHHSVWVTLNGGPTTPEVKLLPKHKKNAEVGEKKTVYASSIILEQQDAASFEDQEEVFTLFDFKILLPHDPIDYPHGLGQRHCAL
jgi:hypothetical protein